MTIRSLAAVPTADRAPHDRGGPAAADRTAAERGASERAASERAATARRASLRAVPVGACADGESRGRVPDGAPASGAAGLASRAIDAWRRLLARRRQARDARSLASLDARTLRDLGIEPDHAARAARGSPPWR